MTEKQKIKDKPTKKKSVIVGLFRKFKNAFYAKAAIGFFGRKSASFDKANKLLDNSFIASLIGKRSKFGKAVAKSRFFIADQFENSLSLHLWRKLLRFLAGCKIRLYGAFFASFGVSVMLGYFAKRYIFSESGSDVWRVAFAVALILAAIPMIVTSRTLSEAFGESLLGRFISQSTLGISETKFDISDVKHGNSYNFAVIAGVGVGVLSIFVDPIILLAVPVIAAVTAVVFYSPEAGVVLTFIILPFAALFGNDTAIIVSVALFSLSYLIKLSRGKRIIKFEITDLFLLLFVFAMACSAVNSNADAAKDVLVPLLAVFGSFVVGNLMRTVIWQKRFVTSYIFASSVVAIFVIIEFIFGNSWSFTEIFGENGFLSNPMYVATFILPAFFAAMTFAFYAAKIKEKAASLLVTLLLVIALAATDQAFGYLIVIGTVLLFLMLRRETVPIVTVGFFAVPVVLTLLPWSVARTLGRAFDLSSAINYSASKVFQGTLSMTSHFWFSGMGFGNFADIYPYFAAVGFEKAERLPSTWLGLYENHGIIGAALIFAVLLLFLMNCFGFIRTAGGNRFKTVVAAGAVSVICLILKSIFFNTTGDIKVLFVMCCVFYVTCAAIRNGRHDVEKYKFIEENTEFSASIDI